MTHSFEALQAQVRTLPQPRLNEIVMQTNRYDEMRAWYAAVMGIDWAFENTPESPAEEKYQPGERQVRAVDVRASFGRIGALPGITFAFFELPWLERAQPHRARHQSHELYGSRPRHLGQTCRTPSRCGYPPAPCRKPRAGDELLLQRSGGKYRRVLLGELRHPEETLAFTKSEAFRNNPSGLELERDEFLARYHSGIPKKELLKI